MSDYVTDNARAALDRITDLFEKWAAEEDEHRQAAAYGIAEGLRIAIEDLREAVHGAPDKAATALAAARAETTTATDEDAADAWQWGGWSTITESAKRPEQAPRILGIANAVTDWIRAHADRTEKGDA